MLDQTNTCLDYLEEKNDHLQVCLQELLDSNWGSPQWCQPLSSGIPQTGPNPASLSQAQAWALTTWVRYFLKAGLQISEGGGCVWLPRPPFWYFPWHTWACPHLPASPPGARCGLVTHPTCHQLNSWMLPVCPALSVHITTITQNHLWGIFFYFLNSINEFVFSVAFFLYVAFTCYIITFLCLVLFLWGLYVCCFFASYPHLILLRMTFLCFLLKQTCLFFWLCHSLGLEEVVSYLFFCEGLWQDRIQLWWLDSPLTILYLASALSSEMVLKILYQGPGLFRWCYW